MQAKAPISAVGSTAALGATNAVGWTPGLGGANGWNSAATRAQPSYVAVVMMGVAEGGTRSTMSGCTITAPAPVFSSTEAYRLLSRKLTSSGLAA